MADIIELRQVAENAGKKHVSKYDAMGSADSTTEIALRAVGTRNLEGTTI